MPAASARTKLKSTVKVLAPQGASAQSVWPRPTGGPGPSPGVVHKAEPGFRLQCERFSIRGAVRGKVAMDADLVFVWLRCAVL